MAWYEKHHRCPQCDTEWYDHWDCLCNDHCPNCDAEIECDEWIDLETGETGNEAL